MFDVYDFDFVAHFENTSLNEVINYLKKDNFYKNKNYTIVDTVNNKYINVII